MAEYDFKTLSPIDFEALVRDLLQEELGVTFESFKAGRDLGIDFRYSCGKNNSWIIQCKHYAGSGVAALKRQLKKEECEKIRSLTPDLYILATSVSLTPQNKDEIVEVLISAGVTRVTVYGGNDLNNLLGTFPRIEKQHFKLWLSSTAVLEELLQSGNRHISRDTLDSIRERARYYVQHDGFGNALAILDKYNVCVIAGIPGIGKTTLANMLILHYLRDGYDLVRVTSDISEAIEADYTSYRRIVFYDDFLGVTSYADKLNKNEEQRLLEFLSSVRRSKVSKVVLTTREYILRQVQMNYERMARWPSQFEKCIIDVSSYTRRIKAQILFNHVYFSGLSKEFKISLISHPGFLKIVDHRNYNPRLIQLLTDAAFVGTVSAAHYYDFVISHLDNPREIWRHTYERQISSACRDFLIVMATMTHECLLDDIEDAFKWFSSHQAGASASRNWKQVFHDVLNEAEGTFITTSRSGESTIVAFQNPSVADFMYDTIKCQPDLTESIIAHVVFFDQIDRMWNIAPGELAEPVFRHALKSRPESLTNAIIRTFPTRSCRLLNVRYNDVKLEKRHWDLSVEEKVTFVVGVEAEMPYGRLSEYVDDLFLKVSERMRLENSDKEDVVRLVLSAKRSSQERINKLQSLLPDVRDFLLTDLDKYEDFGPVCDFREAFPEHFSEGDWEAVRYEFQTLIVSPLSHCGAPEDPDWLRSDAQDIEDLGKKLGVNVNDAIQALEERATEIEEEMPSEPDSDDYRAAYRDNGYISDSEVNSMFDILREGA